MYLLRGHRWLVLFAKRWADASSSPLSLAVSDFLSLPKQVAWILATRRVFMYPELLPTCSPKAKTPRDKVFFTKGEDK